MTSNFPAARQILLFGALISSSAVADVIDERLASFEGLMAGDVTATFGEPAVKSSISLIYLFNQITSDMVTPQPTPLDPLVGANGNNGGVGTQRKSPISPPLPCELRFILNEAGQVLRAEHHGPGCFEIVYSRTKSP